MEYGPGDCMRDLEKVWLGTASEDEQASLDFFLLDVLRDGGAAGIAALLESDAARSLGSVIISESGPKVVFTISREDHPPLSIITFVDCDLLSTHVLVESVKSTPVEENPLHAAFYAIWERLIETGLPEQESGDPAERAVFLIATLEAEIMNGGFGQYLTNTEGAYLSETFDLLARIGASKTRGYLEAAVELAAGWESYVAAWHEQSERYSDLDSEFMDCGDDLAAMTAAAFLMR